MQYKRIYILSFIAAAGFICPLQLAAQDSLPSVKKTIFIHSAFYYDFPKSLGASAGVDFPLQSKIKITHDKNGKEKTHYRDFIVNADIGFYRYRFNNTGIFFIPSVGKRYSSQRPYYFEILLGAGLVRTFYDGIVYTVDENGKVDEKSYFGRFYATANIATTFGYDFEKSKQPKPFAIQVKPVLWFQFPYNSFMLPHLSVEAGVKYHFKNWTIKVKQKQMVAK